MFITIGGVFIVGLAGTVFRGDYLRTTTIAGVAVGSSSANTGDFAIAVTNSASGQITAVFVKSN